MLLSNLPVSLTANCSSYMLKAVRTAFICLCILCLPSCGDFSAQGKTLLASSFAFLSHGTVSFQLLLCDSVCQPLLPCALLLPYELLFLVHSYRLTFLFCAAPFCSLLLTSHIILCITSWSTVFVFELRF